MKLLRRLLSGVAVLLILSWAALAVYACWPASPGLPPGQLAAAADSFITVDGLALRYRSYGTAGPGKPDVVLIHGFANSLQSFRLLAPLLSRQFHVLAVDAPGFGLSDKPAPHDYGNQAQAQVISHFAAALGLDRYIIGGHSMGGTLAAYIAATDPHVIGVVLMNPGIITTGVPAITQHLFWPLPRVMARLFGNRGFRADFLKRSFLDDSIITDQVLDDMMLAPRSTGYLDAMAAMMEQYRIGEEPAMASRIRVPTLIVCGMQDRSKAPGECAEVQRLIPGSSLVEVQGSGHYVQEEQPAAVADAMIAQMPRWR